MTVQCNNSASTNGSSSADPDRQPNGQVNPCSAWIPTHDSLLPLPPSALVPSAHSIHVRDSKDVDIPSLELSPDAWAAFVARIG
ncbi:hypothetical protein GCM10010230_18020 [Streptomyces narbonensis]|uniref:DUF397 domain-containing protein n=1 Tax=Streptomyces narbonensis TaxID=67333 RepID=UPI00199BB5B5|nr:DUF397 domain-containing protein [Streptomyces narbonensis]GGV97493.1 hypothetical protein GCM10010230_18020 [Streptomyces narbonensis]